MDNPVISPAEAASTLRTTIARLRDAGADAEPVLIGSSGEPDAVLLPYSRYQVLLAAAELADDATLAVGLEERLAQAPAPGEGLDNDALAALLIEVHPELADDVELGLRQSD